MDTRVHIITGRHKIYRFALRVLPGRFWPRVTASSQQVVHWQPFADGSKRPIVLKKALPQTARILTLENATFARCYLKFEPRSLSQK